MVRLLRLGARSVARSVLGEETYRRTLRMMNDRRQRPRIGKVRFGDLRRTDPICREYGFERGKPIDRYYIERFLTDHGHLITGSVLEIGERTYTEAFGNGVTRSDMLHVSDPEGATYVADLADAPNVPSNSYDCIIMTQTLHMIFDMKAAVRSIYRILKPGGVLLCTSPGITQVADPGWNHTWYWSLTELSANRLFGCYFPPGNVDVRAFGNVLSATAFLQGLAERELRPSELNVFDPEYPVVVSIVARKGGVGQRHPIVNRGEPGQHGIGDEEASYRLAMEFLDEAGRTIEDWGAGAGSAKSLVGEGHYVGVDGSADDPAMIRADLQDYSSDVDGLIVRHVLEHSWGWRRILANAVGSFRRRMVVVISTPLGDSELRLDNERPIPDLQLPRDEVLGFFKGLTVREETIVSPTGNGTETLFYVQR